MNTNTKLRHKSAHLGYEGYKGRREGMADPPHSPQVLQAGSRKAMKITKRTS